MFAVQGEGILTSKLATLRANRLQELTGHGMAMVFTNALIMVRQNEFAICGLPSVVCLLPFYGWAAGICTVTVLQQEIQHSVFNWYIKKKILFYNKDTDKWLYILIAQSIQ